jgi:teichuronic acid biosynthesis glycosyltransferase TuaC
VTVQVCHHTSRSAITERDSRAQLESEDCRLHVVMLVGGFPDKIRPDIGIFNLRAAQGLARLAKITVVRLRAWLPGRRRIAFSQVEGLPVVTVCVPQVYGCPRTNLFLYRMLGWPMLRSVLENCDIVHSVGADFAGVLASTWARRSGVHHVTQVTGVELDVIFPRLGNSRFVSGWENYLHGVACNSEVLKHKFLAVYPQVNNVCKIWRGVDLERFQPTGPPAGPLAAKAPVRFLFLGGMPSYRALPYGSNTKGGETVMQMWQASEEELVRTHASLLIAGPMGNRDRVYRWRASLRRPDQVYVTGTIHPDLVPAYIRASDVVLVPSLQEGLPNVAMEASACGRAVFGSISGGIPEVVVHRETGLLIPAGDVSAWKNAVVAYSDRLPCLTAMGKKARARMEELFDAKKYPAKLMKLYQQALKEPLFKESTTETLSRRKWLDGYSPQHDIISDA